MIIRMNIQSSSSVRERFASLWKVLLGQSFSLSFFLLIPFRGFIHSTPHIIMIWVDDGAPFYFIPPFSSILYNEWRVCVCVIHLIISLLPSGHKARRHHRIAVPHHHHHRRCRHHQTRCIVTRCNGRAPLRDLMATDFIPLFYILDLKLIYSHSCSFNWILQTE